jgi:hypothetical protein
MARGVLETIGLALTLVFALPVALLGLQFLVLDNRPLLGAGFLAIALLMIAVEQYVTTPTDLPGMVLGETVGKVVTMPGEKEGDEGSGDDREIE